MRLWNGKSMLLGCVVAVAVGSMAASTAEAAAPWEEYGKLRVAGNGRYLEHAGGTPMLWIADTGWVLFYKLRREDVVEYLDQRSRQGFNVVQAVAYCYPHGEDGPGPTNAANQYGHPPFEGGADDVAGRRVRAGKVPQPR
jgi:hypothetical protein